MEFSNKIQKDAVKKHFEDTKFNIFEEVDLEEFEFDIEEQKFFYPCPCGDLFEISVEDLELSEDIAECPSCSLKVKVIYDQNLLEELLRKI